MSSPPATQHTSPGRGPRLRKLARRGLVLLALAVGGALACELALRLYYRAPLVERYFGPANNSAGYGLQASQRYEYLHDARRVTVTTDAEGRRVVPDAPPEAPNTLYVVGDSQAFGWGLSDAETVAARLQQRLGSEWRVVNLGVPGYGPLAYAERLAKLDGGVALVLQTETNDFHDAHFLRPEMLPRCGYLVPRTRLGKHTPCFLLSSYLLVKMTELRVQAAGVLPLPMGYNPHARAAAGVLRYRIDNLYQGALEGKPARAVFAVVPWDAAVAPARLSNYEPRLSQAQRLVELSDECGLDGAFREHASRNELFQEDDSHLSPLGADFAAERLIPCILRAASPR